MQYNNQISVCKWTPCCFDQFYFNAGLIIASCVVTIYNTLVFYVVLFKHFFRKGYHKRMQSEMYYLKMMHAKGILPPALIHLTFHPSCSFFFPFWLTASPLDTAQSDM